MPTNQKSNEVGCSKYAFPRESTLSALCGGVCFKVVVHAELWCSTSSLFIV